MASRGVDKFSGVSWAASPVTGSPVIDGTLGYVDCQIHNVHEAGDHYVVVGRVLDLGIHDAEQPLLFFEGQYTSTDT
jgi:3-hydroxy-9,10-secoandrosta-1,3,5(10)-triene-9,17-dione monooxygenase reductase component